MKCSLRKVRTDDLEWLYQLKEESYREIVIRQFGSWDVELQRKKFFDKWHAKRSAQMIVIGAIKIGVIVVEQREHYDWLGDIQIKAEYQKQGLGTSIIQQYVSLARSRERQLRLQVLHENRQAIRFYKRLGFVEIDLLENHYLMENK